MRLVVISHTPHYVRDGVVVGWGPTIRELDHLATRFTQVRHVACLHRDEAAPASSMPYRAANIELVAVPPSGGDGLRGKLDVLRTSPIYIRTILRELANADVVHVRSPAHIALFAMLLLGTRKRPSARWIKYAGNWQPNGPEALSYAFQRWWLARPAHRGIVTVNGEWAEQPAWIRTFYNPSLSDADLDEGRVAAERKRLTAPIRMLYVGRIEHEKGAERALEITARLASRGLDVTLDLIGDGPLREGLEQRAWQLQLGARARFVGPQPPDRLRQYYATAHFSLLPTFASEGWPKVLSEGMAYGAVPVAGAVSSIPQYIARFGSGSTFPALEVDAFTSAIEGYVREPARWAAESQRAVAAAEHFSFRYYLRSVDTLLADLGV